MDTSNVILEIKKGNDYKKHFETQDFQIEKSYCGEIIHQNGRQIPYKERMPGIKRQQRPKENLNISLPMPCHPSVAKHNQKGFKDNAITEKMNEDFQKRFRNMKTLEDAINFVFRYYNETQTDECLVKVDSIERFIEFLFLYKINPPNVKINITRSENYEKIKEFLISEKIIEKSKSIRKAVEKIKNKKDDEDENIYLTTVEYITAELGFVTRSKFSQLVWMLYMNGFDFRSPHMLKHGRISKKVLRFYSRNQLKEIADMQKRYNEVFVERISNLSQHEVKFVKKYNEMEEDGILQKKVRKGNLKNDKK